jgi:PAS domain S-box-containing protein
MPGEETTRGLPSPRRKTNLRSCRLCGLLSPPSLGALLGGSLECPRSCHRKLPRRNIGPRPKRFRRKKTVEPNSITDGKRAEEALRERERRVQTIYDRTYEFIGLLKPDGTVIGASRTALAFRGLQLKDVAGKPFWETPWWDISQAQQEKLKAAIAEAANGRFVRIEAQHKAQDGAIEDIDFSLTPITDSTGKVTQIIPEGRRITALTRAQDHLRQAHVELERRVLERTVELEQAYIALRESEARTRAFLENSATIAWMKDAEGRYVYLSPNYERRFAIRADDWRGKTDFELWPPEVADVFHANDRAVLRDDCVIEVVEEARHPDGSRSWWLNHKFPYQDAAGKRYVGGLGVEITDRKRAEEELRRSRDELHTHRTQLQDMTTKLLAAQEHERRRVARELHDDVSQRLAALVIDVASLEQQPPVLPELVPQALEPIRQQLERLSDDVHNLAYKLHPSLLEHAGLQPAVEDLIQQVMKRSGVRIALKARDIPASLSLDRATCLFRVLQESLQNITKHANATEVVVKLSGSPNGIGLSVTDNGKGFDANDKSAHQKGLGLVSMRERLRLLHGFLRIHSRPADGTKVCAWIPYQERDT